MYPLEVLGSDGEKRIVRIVQGPNGLTITPDGTGDCCSRDGAGTPIFLEHRKGAWKLHVWGDINEQEATHRIDLTGALESNRRPK